MNVIDLAVKFAPFVCVPVCISLLKFMFEMVMGIAKGTWSTAEERKVRIEEDEKKEKKKETEEIDSDLKKYFDYEV